MLKAKSLLLFLAVSVTLYDSYGQGIGLHRIMKRSRISAFPFEKPQQRQQRRPLASNGAVGGGERCQDGQMTSLCKRYCLRDEISALINEQQRLKDGMEMMKRDMSTLKEANRKLREKVERTYEEDGGDGEEEGPNVAASVAMGTTPATKPVETNGKSDDKQLDQRGMIRDCEEAMDFQIDLPDGVYTIQPVGARKPIQVYCQFEKKTAWTLIQRRVDNSTDFYRNWQQYKNGFGDLESNFWLGNEQIHLLTNQDDYKMWVELYDWNDKQFYAAYTNFKINNEEDKYRLLIGGYTGDAGDAMRYHNEQLFSTKDQDNDEWSHVSCAADFHAGWWYRDCYDANLNGRYYNRGDYAMKYMYEDGIEWSELKERYSMKKTVIKIRRNRYVA